MIVYVLSGLILFFYSNIDKKYPGKCQEHACALWVVMYVVLTVEHK